MDVVEFTINEGSPKRCIVAMSKKNDDLCRYSIVGPSGIERVFDSELIATSVVCLKRGGVKISCESDDYYFYMLGQHGYYFSDAALAGLSLNPFWPSDFRVYTDPAWVRLSCCRFEGYPGDQLSSVRLNLKDGSRIAVWHSSAPEFSTMLDSGEDHQHAIDLAGLGYFVRVLPSRSGVFLAQVRDGISVQLVPSENGPYASWQDAEAKWNVERRVLRHLLPSKEALRLDNIDAGNRSKRK